MKDNENRRPMPQAETDGIIEGRNAVIEALRAGTAIDKIYLAKGETDKTLGHIASRARDAGVVVVEADRRKLDAMSRTHAHQGVIALAAALSAPAWAATKTVTLSVPGMTCAACPITVKTALSKVAGVEKAEVSFEKREAVVTFDEAKTNADALTKATANAGYPSSVKQ